MDTAILLPSPPSCQPNPANAIKVGENVMVGLVDGTNLPAKLALFNVEQAFVAVFLKDKPRPVKVPFARLQALHITSPKPWNPQESDPPAMPFSLFFHDGSDLSGECIGYCRDKHGVHIYPKHGANKYVHSYIPFSALTRCEVNGESLEFAVSAAPVRKAAAPAPKNEPPEQADKQAYLSTKAIDNAEDLHEALIRQKSMPHLKLGEILIGENLVTEEQLNEALEEQKTKKGTPLGELLVQKGLVTTGEIQQSLAKKLGIPFVDLGKFQIAPDALKHVPHEIAEKHTVIPVHFYNEKLAVAIENPMDWDALDALRFHTNIFIEPVMATAESIKKAILYYYTADDIAKESIEEIADGSTDLQSYDEDEDNVDDKDITDNVIVKLLNKVIVDAQGQGVSDIHVEPSPGKGKVKIRFRKDGSLMDYHELPSQYKNALISRIKILAKLDISEKRRPQDGKIEFKRSDGGKLELRVAIIPTANGQEDVVMRILASGKPLPLDKLALSDHNIDALKKAVSTPYGLFLVCGPTGSGKTTTLHSILGYINTPERKIWTAEDPVEITQQGLRQVQMNTKIGLDFAAAMRAFLRADPDVIMVGEMRDHETVHIGVEASLTGHLVFSTLHTNSAPESIVRLLDMGMDPFNFADALLGVLAQRLAKRLCKDCKEKYVPSDTEILDLAREYCVEFTKNIESEEEKEALYRKTMDEWKKKYGGPEQRLSLYRKVGCEKCDGKGYAGRIGLHELLIGSDGIKRHILDRDTVSVMTQTALKEGMRTLRQDGVEKVVQGHTDMFQIHAVCSK